MLKKTLFKKRSVIFTWLISYLLVLAVPVVITAVTYINTVKTVEKEINNYNTLLLKRIQQQMDGVLSSTERLSYEINFNARVNKLLQASGTFMDVPPYTLYEVVRDLGMYKIPSRYIDNFYIYFKNTDTVVSSINGLDSKSYYNIYVESTGYPYEQWKDLISGTYKGEYIPVHYEDIRGHEVRTVSYALTIPLGSDGKNTANVVIMLDETRFQDDIKDMGILNKGRLLIIDKDNKVIASSSMDKGFDSFKYEDLNSRSGLIHEQVEGEKVVISYITSDVAKWKYIVVIPNSAFWEQAEYIRRLTVLSLLICLVVGGFITFFSLRRNYNPIKQLIQVLEKYEGMNFDSKNNEYSFIQEVIDKVHTEKEKVDKLLVQQNKVLRAAFLTRLLKGKEVGKIPIQESLLLHDIKLKSQHFAVMVFYIDDFSKIFSSEADDKDSVAAVENLKLVQFIMTNVIEELAGQQNQGFMADVDDMMACIINFDEELVPQAKEEMVRIAGEAQSFLKENFNIDFMVSTSNVHETTMGISEAYYEAVQAMEYKRLLGIEHVVHYGDIKEEENEYYYPHELERRLISSIRAGNFSKSKAVFDEIFQNGFTQSMLSVEISKCLMFNTVNMMIRSLAEVSSSESADFVDKSKPVEKLLRCESTNEIKNEMLKILKVYCQRVDGLYNSKNKNDENQWKYRVEGYVQENYYDENMSVTAIAEVFDVHPVYLSRVFREQSGENLLDYINRVRIEKAKELVKEQSYTLEELSKAVGYNNTKTFTRAFKKYEGTTPGKFKDMLN